MRYVDQHGLTKPDGWFDRAKAAADAVAAGGDPNDSAAVWRELKDHLAELLPDKKCWYCESPVDRSDNAVDHFRPKNRVSDARAPHGGYRWLAFDSKNFRYACTFCNCRRKDVEHGTSGGKGDRFPLLNEGSRVYSAGPVNQERPALLDPCELHDWELLGCKQENGKPCTTSSDATHCERVEMSIDVYYLHYEPTCKRRHALAVQLMADVEQAKCLFEQVVADPSKWEDFNVVARKIRRTIDRKAMFSGEMIFLLKGQRHADHAWIQKLLEM